MEISDLAGLSKPLERLIEVTSKGVGALSNPYVIKKEAIAEAQKIRILCNAITEATGQKDLMVTYDKGEIAIWPSQQDRSYNPTTTTLDERAKSRLDYQERKKQNNIENITSTAAIELMDETDIPDKSPDDDWITRFFEYAPNVSTELMQDLWGRLLSGEIKRPGSFSLRTLDFLKNTTTEEATLFDQVAQLSIWITPNEAAIPAHDFYWLETRRNLTESNIIMLGELGLINDQEFVAQPFQILGRTKFIIGFHYELIEINRGKINRDATFPVRKFTKMGVELLNLIEKKTDIRYLEFIGKYFAKLGANVSIIKLKNNLPNGEIEFETIKKM